MPLAWALLGCCALGQLPTADLVVNGDFEAGITGWTLTSGTASVVAYGGPNGALGGPVGLAISGGNQYLRDIGSGVASQTIDLTAYGAAIAAGAEVDLSAYLGGGLDTDASRIELTFLNGAISLGTFTLGPVSWVQRNREAVLMRRRASVSVPTGTTSVRIAVVMTWAAGTPDAAADRVALSLRTSQAPAPLPLDQQLLHDGGFESGWNVSSGGTSPLDLNAAEGWVGFSGGSSTALPYGFDSNTVPATLSPVIGGGGRVLRDAAGGATLEQVLDVRGHAAAIGQAGIALALQADLGGSLDNDSARVDVEFRDALGSIVGTDVLGPVGLDLRNRELVLLRRSKTIVLPPQTASVSIRPGFGWVSGNPDAQLDNVVARLTTALPPGAQPLDQNLVVNAGFESGWTPGSPLTPADAEGWIGGGGSGFTAVYGSGGPGVAVGLVLGGGGRYFQDLVGNAILEQRFDVRGNSAAIAAGTLLTQVTADLGGTGADRDDARIELEFRRADGVSLGVAGIDPVTPEIRNRESVLQRRRNHSIVPVDTAEIVLRCRMTWLDGSPNGAADNIDLRLVTSAMALPKPLNTELLVNGTFDSGWDCSLVPGCGTACSSPLTLDDTDGWFGIASSVVGDQYGQPSAPSNAFAAVHQSGCSLLRDSTGNGRLRQLVDVSGNAPEIDAQDRLLAVSACLGGVGSDTDRAQVVIEFWNVAGSPIVSGPPHVIGPVTAADRGNLTVLLRREGEYPVPVGTRTISVEIQMTWSAGGPGALVDSVSARLVDCTGSGQVNRVAARLDVNGIGGIVCAGPHDVAIPTGGLVQMSWSGPALMPIVLAVGYPLAPGVNGLNVGGGVGIVDISLTLPIDIVFDGTLGTFPDVLFRLSPAGEAFQSFSVPAPGASVTIQGALLQPPGSNPPLLLTAAFNLTFL